MEFSWDESKRECVLAGRGIDFLRVAFSLFDGRPLLTVPTPRGGEERFMSIGPMEEDSLPSYRHGGKERYELSPQGEREMRKKSDTVRYTAKQLSARVQRGEDRTNWRKANAIRATGEFLFVDHVDRPSEN